MGCKNSKDKYKQINVTERWKLLKMPDIPLSNFENEFELALYKTICLIRHDPIWFIPYVQKAKDN